MVDLHIHTSASADADYSSQEIINFALQSGVKTIAITDHNHVASIAPAISEGAKQGITVVPGIEIDAEYKGLVLHILGYNIDYTDAVYEKLSDFYLGQEEKSSWVTLDKLCSHLGISIDEQAVRARLKGNTIVGEDIADILLSDSRYHKYDWLGPYLPGGSRSDNPNVNFFWDFMGQGRPAYTPINFLQVQEVLELIHNTGGIAVIAHPCKITEHSPQLFNELTDMHFEGIEVYSSYHTREDTEFFYRIAKEKGMLITCGSDFHGMHKPSITVGGIRYIKDSSELFRG